MAPVGRAVPLLLVGLLFHAVYLVSIFDIYFVSPVVRVEKRFSPLDCLDGESSDATRPTALADRLVLIVGDGLRADKLFGSHTATVPSTPLPFPSGSPDFADRAVNSTTPAPYLRGLIESGRAGWGVSHTRVPTESRPGHVALIAGMYEDVSAVTKGWKLNPVTFDSVFNQSSHTFSFGSPDILPMFKHGASPPSKVDAFSYDEAFEDFTKDAVQLDIWVHDKLRSLLELASTDAALAARLRQEKTVFFLHLLGLDTTGHAYRPHSSEYYRNIEIVDAIVQKVERMVESFFGGDGRTAYVFTADHGMSNIGNHGDGDPDNTRTPLVVWGSGVRASAKLDPPVRWAEERDGDRYFTGWGLEDRERVDVEQADVATLMAALLGIDIPANSAGRLPLAYLDATGEQKARAGLAVARQILEQYQAKHDLRASRALNFQPFPELPDEETVTHQTAAQRVFWIQRLILSGRYDEALEAESVLADLALHGLRYLQRYDWLLLRTIVVAGYIGWIAYAARFVLRTYTTLSSAPTRPSRVQFAPLASWTCFLALAARFAIERAPPTYYLYAVFPAYFWSTVLADLDAFRAALRKTQGQVGPIVVSLTIAIAALEGMVAGYFQRIAWSFGWFVLAVAWPSLGMSIEFRKDHRKLLAAWTGAALATSCFTLLPVEKGENLPLVAAGGLAFLVGGLIWRRSSHSTPSILHLVLTAAATVVSVDSGRRLQLKQGLPLANQIIGWAIVLLSTTTASAPQRPRLSDRLASLIAAFAPIFVILSISYETLFYFAYAATLILWLELEGRLGRRRDSQGSAALEFKHVRLGLFFLFFIHVGFFGTGNVASISSFYLEPVYRLVPVFNPFLMAALLIYKLMIPFLIASVVFAAVNRRLGLPPFSLFVAALTASDVLTLNFFFLVTDRGSWLEIGQSISHFSIASLLLVFMILLHGVGEWLLGWEDDDRGDHAKQD